MLYHIPAVFDVHPTTITHFQTWQKLKFYRKLEIFPKLIRISRTWVIYCTTWEYKWEYGCTVSTAICVLQIPMNITKPFDKLKLKCIKRTFVSERFSWIFIYIKNYSAIIYHEAYGKALLLLFYIYANSIHCIHKNREIV